MAIQLRHRTQQQRLPSAQSHGVGLPVSDGGLGAASRALGQVAGAAGQIGARLQRKEEGLQQLYGKKLASRRSVKIDALDYEYQEALSQGNTAKIKEIQGKAKELVSQDLNTEWLPNEDRVEVDSKYQEPYQIGLQEKYGRWSNKVQAETLAFKSATEFTESVESSLGSPVKTWSDSGLIPEGSSEAFLQEIEEIKALGAYQESQEGSPSRVAKENILLGHVNAAVEAIKGLVANEPDAIKANTMLEEGRKIVQGLDVGSGDPEIEKQRGVWNRQLKDVKETRFSDSGLEAPLQKVDNFYDNLMSQTRSPVAEEWAQLEQQFEAIQVPETSKHFSKWQSRKAVSRTMQALSDPSARSNVISIISEGEFPSIPDEITESGDRSVVRDEYRDIYRRFTETEDPYEKMQALDPRFEAQYAEATAMFNSVGDEDMSQAAIASLMGSATTLSEFDLMGDFNPTHVAPLYKEFGEFMNQNADNTKVVGPKIHHYNQALRSLGINPRIAMFHAAVSSNPETKEAAAFSKLYLDHGQNVFDSTVIKAVTNADEPLTDKMQKVQNLTFRSFTRPDKQDPVFDHTEAVVRALEGHGQPVEAAMVDFVSGALLKELLRNTSDISDPDEIADTLNSQIRNLYQILPGDTGIVDPVVTGDVYRSANINDSWWSRLVSGGVSSDTYAEYQAKWLYEELDKHHDLDQLAILQPFGNDEDGRALNERWKDFITGGDSLESLLEYGHKGKPAFRISVDEDDLQGSGKIVSVLVIKPDGTGYDPLYGADNKPVTLPYSSFLAMVNGTYAEKEKKRIEELKKETLSSPTYFRAGPG